MTKLDLVLARIKQLSPEQQDAVARKIEFVLNSGWQLPLKSDQRDEVMRQR